MTLPLTYYDTFLNARPRILRYIEKDVKTLKDSGRDLAVYTTDSFNSSFEKAFEYTKNEIIDRVAKTSRVNAYEVLKQWSHIKQMPEIHRELIALLIDYHAILNFDLFGKKTFFFRDNLVERLAHTEVNVPSSLIELPFTSCSFVFTAVEAINALYKLHNGNTDNLSIKHEGINYNSPVTIFLAMFPQNNGTDERKLMIVAHQGKMFLVQRELLLSSDRSLEDSIRTDWGTVSLKPDNAPENDSRFYTDGEHFIRLVLNAILYLGSASPDIQERASGREKQAKKGNNLKSKAKQRKHNQTVSRESVLDYSEVGSNVHPITVDHTDGTNAGTSKIGTKIGVQFIVRGHWRNQPHGIGHQERKLKWINPYVKGKDLSEIINNPYIVQ